MNEIANERATQHDLCPVWDSIIVEVNQATGGRLALKPRTRQYDVLITLRFSDVPIPAQEEDVWIDAHITQPLIRRVDRHIHGIVYDDLTVEGVSW